MDDSCDIAIIGAGAAGLAAAVFAASGPLGRDTPLWPPRPLYPAGEGTGGSVRARRPKVILLDGARSIGAKILVSGGGRCNVTHDIVRPEDFAGSRNIVRNILAAFSVEAAVQWFGSMGVHLKREETGKLFPVTDSARTVLGALLRRCDELRVAVRTDCRVSEVSKDTAAFTITHTHGRLAARCIILATGGRSLPKTGSDGAGWEIARRLGHTVTETYPALVPLVLNERFFHAELSGLSCDVELTTVADGKRIDRRRGSLLWTHFGISGPVVMDASRHWVIPHARGQRPELLCSFLPDESCDSADPWLRRLSAEHPQWTPARALAEKLPDRLAAALAKWTGVEQTPLSQLPRDARRRLVQSLIALPLPVARDRGWNYAEVTAGGVPLAEIDYRMMASRRTPGLYLIGEMLDCDGRIGGFNFQWAWATGRIAGMAAARACAAQA